jgi:tetratricopeptide (TPR) repeat protein
VIHGDEHPETIASLNNLAFLFVDMGVEAEKHRWGRSNPGALFAKARDYLLRALEIQEKALPERHPRIADSLNSLGDLFGRQGDLDAAEHYLKRALVIRLQMLGDSHPDTARTLTLLGLVSVGRANHWREQAHRASGIPYLPRYPEQRGEPLRKEHSCLVLAKEYLERAVAAFEHTRGASGRSTASGHLDEVRKRLGERVDPPQYAPPQR